jgi:hypothetical protein
MARWQAGRTSTLRFFRRENRRKHVESAKSYFAFTFSVLESVGLLVMNERPSKRLVDATIEQLFAAMDRTVRAADEVRRLRERLSRQVSGRRELRVVCVEDKDDEGQ